jgi:hypothetical protein
LLPASLSWPSGLGRDGTRPFDFFVDRNCDRQSL